MGFFDKWKARKEEEERKAEEWQKTLKEIEVERTAEDKGWTADSPELPGKRGAVTSVFGEDWLDRLKEQVEAEKSGELPSDTARQDAEGPSLGKESRAAATEGETSIKDHVLQKPALGSKFDTLFSAAVGRAFANQQAFAKKVAGDKEWFIDFEKGIIAFEDQEFPVQLLGSESDQTGTWLWSWANNSPLPEKVKTDALICKAYGEEHNIPELSVAQQTINEHLNGHTLTILSTSVIEENVCYYRAPYEGGAVFVLVKDLPEEIFRSVDCLTFANLCTQIISAYAVDHKKMVEGFLKSNGCEVDWKNDLRIAAEFPSEESLMIEFDIYGRIKSMNPEVK